MTNPVRRFDNFWSNVDSADLKRMAALWGGSSKMRKDQCIDYLIEALNDPRRIDSAITRMLPHERTVLGLLKLCGGAMDLGSLGLAVRTTGTAPAEDRYGRAYGGQSLGTALLERGIVMTETGERYISYSSSDLQLFADERIIARIGPLEFKPLPMEAVQPPANPIFRRVQSVVLDVISILRTVNDIGGIGLTKSGDLRINDLRKFARKMGWSDQIEIDGLPFPEPARAYVSVLTASGLLSQEGDSHAVAVPLEHAATRKNAIGRGVTGLAVGERFLLLQAPHPKVSMTGVTLDVIDYAHEPARCLSASEDGLITLAVARRDLLTPGYLDLWAARK